MKILVTGATGFVGRSLCSAAIERNWSVIATVRKTSDRSVLPPEVELIEIESLDSGIPDSALENVDAIVHLAARVHVMNDVSDNPLESYRQVNTIPTLSLAQQAARMGVRRFIYLSSIKVNGEGGLDFHTPYTEEDEVPPSIDPYGQSKWEAEAPLRPLNPPILGDFEYSSPQFWGARGAS